MATQRGPKIVRDGLVLCLDAADRKSYAGSGNNWFDLSGNNRTGTLTPAVNGPTFSSSNGGSIVFDGSDDYVSGTLPSLSAYTIDLWFYSTDITSKLIFYIFSGTSSVATGIGFGGTYVTETNNRWYYADDVPMSNSNMTITTNKWYNLTLTDNGSNSFTFYTNGQLSWGSVPETSRGLNVYSIGRRASDGAWNAKGNMAITRVYNRVLSASEILQNFNAQRGRFGI